MYDVLPDLPRFWFIDADEVIRDDEDVKSIDEDVDGDADDDDELGKKYAIMLEDWIVDFKSSFLLDGIVEDVVPVDVGAKSSLNMDF